MFNKLMHLLSKMVGSDQSHQQVKESMKRAAEDHFIYDITNGRGAGYNRKAIRNGHEKIGDFIHRGIQVQTRKIKEGV